MMLNEHQTARMLRSSLPNSRRQQQLLYYHYPSINMARRGLKRVLRCVAFVGLYATAATIASSPGTTVIDPLSSDHDPCRLRGVSIQAAPTYFEDSTSAQANAFAICDNKSIKCFMHYNGYFPVLPIDCSEMIQSRRLATKGKNAISKQDAISKSRAASKSKDAKAKSVLDKQKVGTVRDQNRASTSKPKKLSKPGSPTNSNMKTHAEVKKNRGKKPLSRARSNSTNKYTAPGGESKVPRTNTSNITANRDADSICKHKGVRIHGYHTLGNKPGFYAVCDESVIPPKLTCYRDVGIVDNPVSDPVVPCMSAPPVSSKKRTTKRQSGSRQLSTYYPDVRLWPGGFICYDILIPSMPTREDLATYLQYLTPDEQGRAYDGVVDTFGHTRDRMPDLTKSIRSAMRLFERYAGITFLHKDLCAKKGRTDICGGCSFSVQFRFEVNQLAPWFGCWSNPGYFYGDPRHTNPTRQYVNLSPGCWSRSGILHELGHVLGLQHDHQHPGRDPNIIVDPVKARVNTEVPASQFSILHDLVGDYAPQSIMHYSYDLGVCLRKEEYANTVFCDVTQSPAANGCVVPEAAVHCDVERSQMLGSKTLSRGDILGLQRMYPPAKMNPPDDPDDIDEDLEDESTSGMEIWGITPEVAAEYRNNIRGGAPVHAVRNNNDFGATT